MTTLREAATHALEALESAVEYDYHGTPLTETHAGFNDAAIALRAALEEPTTCAWHGDEEGAYETSCKHIFQMIDGTPQENDFTHCCFCGKSLVQHPWEDDNDE